MANFEFQDLRVVNVSEQEVSPKNGNAFRRIKVVLNGKIHTIIRAAKAFSIDLKESGKSEMDFRSTDLINSTASGMFAIVHKGDKILKSDGSVLTDENGAERTYFDGVDGIEVGIAVQDFLTFEQSAKIMNAQAVAKFGAEL